MYQLSEKSLEILKNEDYVELRQVLEDQKSFLIEHLLKWVPELTEKILASAELDFYPGMAKILKGYLKSFHFPLLTVNLPLRTASHISPHNSSTNAGPNLVKPGASGLPKIANPVTNSMNNIN